MRVVGLELTARVTLVLQFEHQHEQHEHAAGGRPRDFDVHAANVHDAGPKDEEQHQARGEPGLGGGRAAGGADHAGDPDQALADADDQ